MLYINKSLIQEFIKHPDRYHLENVQGTITALTGRHELTERMHQTALESLQRLPLASLEGQGRWFTCLMPWFYLSDLTIARKCKQADFTYKLTQWAQAGEAVENRAQAARCMTEAYILQQEQLNLNNLHLRSLPVEILQITTLKQLSLDGNSLDFLPDSIDEFSDEPVGSDVSFYLTPFAIADKCKKQAFKNKINQWAKKGDDKELRDLAASRIISAYNTKQTELDLEGLSLKSLPKELGKLIHLQTLNLSINNLLVLPQEIGCLTQLTELNLRWNRLINIPPQIGQLRQLQILDLSINQLHGLPIEMENLTKLQYLKISNNPMVDSNDRIKVFATYLWLLKTPLARGVFDESLYVNLCQINGLALKFIPDEMKSFLVIRAAITQNPESFAFVPYELAKGFIALDPKLARFFPKDALDVDIILSQVDTEPYLVSLLFKKQALETLIEQNKLDKDKALELLKGAIAYDYRVLGCVSETIQNFEFEDQLIKQALEQDPKAFYEMEFALFTEQMLSLMIQRHQDHPDLVSVLNAIVETMDTDDQDLAKRLSDLAYPLSQYFILNPPIQNMLKRRYGV